MPFLFYRNQSFTLVSHKSKQGIFYQNYTQKGFSRPYMLHNYPTTLYSATIDHEGTLHIISQTSKTQITYFKITDTQVTKQIILEDAKNSYSFSNLAIHCLQEQIYLFYTALHPTGNTRSLMCQILTQDPTIYTLIPSLSDSPVLQIFSVGDTISIIYLTYDQSYILREITIDYNFDSHDLVYAQLPISDFNICRNGDTLHLLYVLDNFGRSQLLYVNPKHNVPVLLKTAATIVNPCIFRYLDYLWITYMENGQLYVLLSMDNGSTFSSPVPCSLQNNLDYYTFMSQSPATINGSSIYASLLNTIRIPVVANLDIFGIHPDILPNTELELLLEGIKLRYTQTPPSPPTPFPLPATPLPGTSLTQSSPPSPSANDPIQKPKSLLLAKKAFMEQGNGFDATPKE